MTYLGVLHVVVSFFSRFFLNFVFSFLFIVQAAETKTVRVRVSQANAEFIYVLAM